MFTAADQKEKVENKIMTLHDEDETLVYFGGAVMESGGAGRGVVIRVFKENPMEEWEENFGYQAMSLHLKRAILLGLREITNRDWNEHFYVENQSAIETFTRR